MIKVQIDQYDMVLTTEKHLDANAAILVSNAAITATKSLLSSKIVGLQEQVALQLVNPTGITVDKGKIRKELEKKAFILGSACCSYASAVGDAAFYNRCRYTKSDLLHLRQAELIGVCVCLYKDANEHASDLILYNVDAAMISDFQAETSNFQAAMQNPREAIGSRTAATAQIDIRLREILELIKTRLDNDVVSMTITAPDFVATYNKVRAINKTRTVKRSLVVTALDAETQLPLSNVEIEIIGKGIRRKSGQSGINRIQNLISGRHRIKLSHKDYETETRSFTVVSGETTLLRMMMNKKITAPIIIDESPIDVEMEDG